MLLMMMVRRRRTRTTRNEIRMVPLLPLRLRLCLLPLLLPLLLLRLPSLLLPPLPLLLLPPVVQSRRDTVVEAVGEARTVATELPAVVRLFLPSRRRRRSTAAAMATDTATATAVAVALQEPEQDAAEDCRCCWHTWRCHCHYPADVVAWSEVRGRHQWRRRWWQVLSLPSWLLWAGAPLSALRSPLAAKRERPCQSASGVLLRRRGRPTMIPALGLLLVLGGAFLKLF